ncbi:PQQ-binding-like beta-propeller repeat protein [Streptomyces sp. AA1529]|uniref:outer membrane protein assembly factor BamB family protein n=1 Tax=Streptomyces sp. AA1529 TaxID=1203257 RepID=UPI0004859009
MVKTRWKAALGARITCRPILSGEACFVTCEDGSVSAVELTSGRPLWSRQVAGSDAEPGSGRRLGSASALGCGAVADGVLYLATARSLVAIETTTGRARWTTDLLTGADTAPTVALTEDEIVVTRQKQISVLRRDTGTPLWSVAVDEEVTGPAAVDGGLVVINCRTQCSAWDLHDGTPVWTTPRNSYFYGGSPAVIHAGVAYMGDGDGSLHALDAETGELRWSTRSHNSWVDADGWKRQKSAAILMPPAVAESRIAVGLTNCTLQCVDLRGEAQWMHLTTPYAFMNPRASDLPDPVIVDDLVIEGGRKPTMQAWDLRTGAEVWKVRRRRTPTTSLAYASGRLLYGAGRTLFAHDARTGKGPWTL